MTLFEATRPKPEGGEAAIDRQYWDHPPPRSELSASKWGSIGWKRFPSQRPRFTHLRLSFWANLYRLGSNPQRNQPVEAVFAQEMSSKGPHSEGHGHSICVMMNRVTPPVMMSRLYDSIIRQNNCFHSPAWNYELQQTREGVN